MAGQNGTDLTLREASAVLEPAITERQLQMVIRALGWKPSGHRRNGRAGHPRAAYPAAELMRLHGALAPWLADSGD